VRARACVCACSRETQRESYKAGEIPDGIISSHPDPVRNGAILLLLLCQLLLNPECFLGRLQ